MAGATPHGVGQKSSPPIRPPPPSSPPHPQAILRDPDSRYDVLVAEDDFQVRAGGHGPRGALGPEGVGPEGAGVARRDAAWGAPRSLTRGWGSAMERVCWQGSGQ